MALPNGDLITTPFDPQMAYPSDRRMQVDTLNSRDSMSMFIRWEGMEVYVLENKTKYILQGGRSNEFWKEQGTGSGTGGTTFVGQFESADLLPTSGRSAGDYAFVGTGDDFVQYNWDNISGQWVMAEGQTDMASEFFHIGYKTPLRRPVIFPLFPKDVLVETSGDFVFAPETAVARFIFTGEVTAIRGIETAAADREINLVNRTGSDIPLRDKASGIPSGSGMDFGGSDYTWVNGSEITLKGNGTYWELAPNNQVAFSDHLDSVNAQVSVGSDGLEVITGIYDRYTGESVQFKEISETPIPDGVIYIQIGSKYYKRIFDGSINILWYGANTQSLTSNVFKFTDSNYIISEDYNIAGGTLTIPSNCTLDFRGGSISNGGVVLNQTLLESDYKFNSLTSLTGTVRNELVDAENINFVNDTAELYYLFRLSGNKILSLKRSKNYSIDTRILSTDANNFATLSGRKNWSIYGNNSIVTDARGNGDLLSAEKHFYFLKILTSSEIYIDNLKYRTDDVNVENAVTGKTWGCAFVQFAESSNLTLNNLSGENISIGVGVSSSNLNAMCKNVNINRLKIDNGGYHVILNGVENINIDVESSIHAHRVIYSGGVKNARYNVDIMDDITLAQTVVLLQEYRVNDGSGYKYLHNDNVQVHIKGFGDIPGTAIAHGMYNYVENTSIGYDMSNINLKVEYFNQTSDTRTFYSGLVEGRSPSSPNVRVSGKVEVIYHNDDSNTSGRRDEPILLSSGDIVNNNIDFDIDLIILSDTFQKKFPRFTYQGQNSELRINSNTDLDGSFWNFNDPSLGVPNIYLDTKSIRPVGNITGLIGPNLIVNSGELVKTNNSITNFKSIKQNIQKFTTYPDITTFRTYQDGGVFNRTSDLSINYTSLENFLGENEERDIVVNNTHATNTITVMPSNFSRNIDNVSVPAGGTAFFKIGKRNGISFIRQELSIQTSISYKNGLYFSSDNLYNGVFNGLTGTDTQGIIRNPIGGLYKGTSTQTGSIKISLPDSYSNKFSTVKGTVYSYQNGESFSFFVSFYSEQTTESVTRYTAKIIGSIKQHPIRIYTDGDHSAIYIGDLDASWAFLNVSIDEVHYSHSTINPSIFEGWSISVVQSFSGTLVGTVLDTFPKTTFTNLIDTPSTYTSQKNKSVKVNNEETAVVFVADGVDVRNVTDGGSIAIDLTDGFISSRLNFTSNTAVTLQGVSNANGQSSIILVNPHASNNLTIVHNGSAAVKYISPDTTDFVISPKTAARFEIVGNEMYPLVM